AVVVVAALAAADLLAAVVVPRAAAPRVVARQAATRRLRTMTANPVLRLRHLPPPRVARARVQRWLRRAAAVRPLPAVPVAAPVARQPARVAAVPRPHARIRRSS